MNSFFCNKSFDKGEVRRLIYWFLINNGTPKTLLMVDQLKTLGFHYATKAGISLGIEDLKIPPVKPYLLGNARNEIYFNKKRFSQGQITAVEHSQKVIDIWNTTSELLKDEVVVHFRQTDLLNPVYMMAFSGARGNISQVRQLVGMRGLMSDPQGEIIDLPIQSNFREGLTVTEYIISCYGARKGLVDTALKTANSGYLTRRLVDVAQAVIINEVDCNTKEGIYLSSLIENGKALLPLEKRLVGRVLGEPVSNPKTKKLIAQRNQDVCPSLARKLIQTKQNQMFVRSPLTCQTLRHICKLCYGWSLAHGQLVDLGEAVGIIAAQSIGEPGTQLTMRTFHTGGVFASDVADRVYAPHGGTIHYDSLGDAKSTLTAYGQKAIYFCTEKTVFITPTLEQGGAEKTELNFPPYTLLFVPPEKEIYAKQVIAEYATYKQIKEQNKQNDGIITKKDVTSEIQGQVVFSRSRVKAAGLTKQTPDLIKQGSNPGLFYIFAGQIIPPSLFPYPLSLKSDLVPAVLHSKKSKSNETQGEFLFENIVRSGGFYYSQKLTQNKQNQRLLWVPSFQKNTNFEIGSSHYCPSFDIHNGSINWFDSTDQLARIPKQQVSTSRKMKSIWLSGQNHFTKNDGAGKTKSKFFDYCFENQEFFIPESFPLEYSFPGWFYFPRQNGTSKRQWKRLFQNHFSMVEPYTKVVDDIYFHESVFSELVAFQQSVPVCIFRKSIDFSVSKQPTISKTKTPKLQYVEAGPLVKNWFSSNSHSKLNRSIDEAQTSGFDQLNERNDRAEVLFVNAKREYLTSSQNQQKDFFRFCIKGLKPLVKPRTYVVEGDVVAKEVQPLKSGVVEETAFQIPETGVIHKVTENYIVLRKGKAYKVGGLSTLFVAPKNFVYEGNILFDLVYKKAKTGDIVQGLPKIEELLEARRTKDLQPIANNPHDRLQSKFERYKKVFPIEIAVKKSLLEIQQFLVDGVQRVYQSQGVSISDKHVEIIVKQMTSKVFIEDGGGTPLIYGELVELDQMKKTCKEALKRGYALPTYEPIILGITKASLKTESFLSAASFQETTRVLTQAAIQGRVDTFKGLKENVIIGRLIPAGTGFLSTNSKSLKGFSTRRSINA